MSTKTRRPPAMSTTTPTKTPARTPRRRDRDAHAKQAVLDNFDLEVQHRTSEMRAQLDSALSAFLALVDADILMIPRALRGMTMGELDSCWAGSFADTSRAIAQRQFDANVPSTDEAAVIAAAKRKRESPSTTKNARSKPLPALPAKTRRTKAKKQALPAATGERPPQASEFNPLLPKTPKYPRQAKRNESFFSENGSPVVFGDGEDDDLPDPEAMEAAAEKSAANRPVPGSPSSRSSRAKRAPSLLFRQSIVPKQDREEAHIPLSDGRSITFNPLNLSPGRIDDELENGGLGEDEKRRVKKEVQDEVCRALAERMERWKAM